MDMIFRDDECRIRTEHAPGNFTTLSHMAHNLIRKAAGKHSFRLKRKIVAADDAFLANLIAACFFHPIPLELPAAAFANAAAQSQAQVHRCRERDPALDQNVPNMECQAFSVVRLAMHRISAREPDIFLANLRRGAGAAPPRFGHGA
jgi:hypothetical protein